MSEPLILTLKKKIEELEKIKTNMTIYTTSEQSYIHTAGDIYLQEPLRFQASRGNPNNKLTFEQNGIKIGAGINHINVKGLVTFMHSESDGRPVYLYIRKMVIYLQHKSCTCKQLNHILSLYIKII